MTSERDRLNQIIDQHGLNIGRVHPMELRDQSYARVCDALAEKLADLKEDRDIHHKLAVKYATAELYERERAEAAEAALKTARRDALEEAADKIHRKIKQIQPEMTRRAQRLAAGKRPGFQYAIHRADLDARISDRDLIRALIEEETKP